MFAQRAQILLDAIEVMMAHPDIDPGRIGLWGISQAGYVMPLALTRTRDVTFMICVSCPGMSGSDQEAFKVTAWALCNEVPEEKADQKARLLAELDGARTYDTYAEYLHYRDVLKSLAGLVSAPLEHVPVVSEETWQQNPTTPESSWNPIGVLEIQQLYSNVTDREKAICIKLNEFPVNYWHIKTECQKTRKILFKNECWIQDITDDFKQCVLLRFIRPAYERRKCSI